MSRRRRLLNFILINIFVSACVTGAILFWYDRTYRATLAPLPQPASTSVEGGAPQAALPPGEEVPVEIVSVVGAGTLGAEVVVVRYNGEDQLDMLNWQLKDDDGNIFTFPQLTLYTNGAVQVHTASVVLSWTRIILRNSGQEAACQRYSIIYGG